MWEEVDCDQRNGRIIEYIVIISSNSDTYNMTTTERYITVNDLVLGGIYNVSVAAVNSIGSGPFRELQIVTSKLFSTKHILNLIIWIHQVRVLSLLISIRDCCLVISNWCCIELHIHLYVQFFHYFIRMQSS